MLWEMLCLGSNTSKNSHYSQDKSPNMAKKNLHDTPLCICLHTYVTISHFIQTDLFSVLPTCHDHLSFRFLHMILPLSGTLLHTSNTHTNTHTKGKILLVTRETILPVLFTISIQCLLHCCTYTSPSGMSRQTNE